jgi:hypothetical protein
MENDFDVEELKELVKRQAALNADTNRVVHSLRRSQRWRTLASIVWWLLILAVSFYSYLTYVQPYVDELVRVYGSAQDFGHNVQGFFGQFGSYFGTSTKPQ